MELKIIDRTKKRQNTVEHINLMRPLGCFLTIVILDDDDKLMIVASLSFYHEKATVYFDKYVAA